MLCVSPFPRGLLSDEAWIVPKHHDFTLGFGLLLCAIVYQYTPITSETTHLKPCPCILVGICLLDCFRCSFGSRGPGKSCRMSDQGHYVCSQYIDARGRKRGVRGNIEQDLFATLYELPIRRLLGGS